MPTFMVLDSNADHLSVTVLSDTEWCLIWAKSADISYFRDSTQCWKGYKWMINY